MANRHTPPEAVALTFSAPAPNDRRRYPPEQVFAAGLRNHHLANTAYPIRHQTTMRPYLVPKGEMEHTAIAAWQETTEMGLYVHVPFCAARCRYCEYTVVDRSEHQAEDRYFDALLCELGMWQGRLSTADGNSRTLIGEAKRTLIGFDIGGGTPAFARADNIRRVVEAVRGAFHSRPGMAISIETTPTIADRDPDKIHALRDIGIERISMGVQTTHLTLARSLGREYDGLGMLERAVRHIRQAGFGRLNLDLMYGFARQSTEAWRVSMEQTIALGPEYITLYQMRYKGTAIEEQASTVTRERVNRLRELAHKLLLQAGYAGAPGKNTYSRVPGDVGTSDYLTERVVKGTPYLGLGLGAQSMSPYTLSYNLGAAAKSLAPYLRAVDEGRLPIQDLYHLPLEAAMAKMIAVSFYFGQIHLESFRRKFGVALEEQFAPEIAFVLREGLMEYAGPALRLTPAGVQCWNGCVALFYAGAVQEYLIRREADRMAA
jgi:oxygen-independent coproporphyrinogen-3 oxidase